MTSANKKVDSKGSQFNLINSYNQLVESIYSNDCINYVKNQNCKDVVINTEHYHITFDGLASIDNVDLEKFDLINWSYYGTTLINMQLLNYSGYDQLTKEEIQNISVIPINITSTNYISQTFDVPFKPNNDYVFIIEYQIGTNSSGVWQQDVKPIGDYDLSISFKVDGSTPTEITNIITYETNELELINTSNYSYMKYIYFRNISYNGMGEVTIKIISDVTTDSQDIFMIKNVIFANTNFINKVTRKNNDNFLDYLRFDEKKKWEMTNNGTDYFPILPSSPLELRSILIRYSDISIASDTINFGISLPKNSSILNITIECLEPLLIGATPAELKITSNKYDFDDEIITTDKILSLLPTSPTAINKYPYYIIDNTSDETYTDSITGVQYSISDPTFQIVEQNAAELNTLTGGSFALNIFYMHSQNKTLSNFSDYVFYDETIENSFINNISGGVFYMSAVSNTIYWTFISEDERDRVHILFNTTPATTITLSGCDNVGNNDTFTFDDAVSFYYEGGIFGLKIGFTGGTPVYEDFTDDSSVTLTYSLI